MKNFSMKRFTASLLCIVMIVATLPVSLFDFAITASAATGETTYVLAGSDFQARKGHDAGAEIVSGLLTQIIKDYPTMDGFLFAGDYDVNYSDSAGGKAKLQETVQSVYGTGMDEIYVQGNHDGDGLVGSTLTASGANDAGAYGVFVINEKDYMWYNDDETTIKNTASNLEAYLNAKRNAGYTKPIFVVSHLPLHYCMRTRSGGNDGMHANYIFDVLNEAGNAGLNIIFMFGHNHSHGWDDYLGGAAIFLTKGDKINIAQNSTTVFKEETLAFTYMNAGYVGYYGDSYTSTVDKTLTMTTFAITDTEVTISRYDSDSTHDLKSAGVYNVEYPDSAYYSTDTTTVASPYTLTLNTTITPAGEEVEAPDSGSTATQRTYTRVTSTSELVSGGQYLIFYNGSHFMLPEVVEKSDGSIRKGFNIESTSICGPDTITGDYSAKEWTLTSSGSGWLLGNGTQYAKLTNTSDYKITATLENSGDVFTIGGSENAFTFSNGDYVFNYNDRGLINGYASNAATFYIYRMTNAGSSTPTVSTSGGSWVTITEPTSGETYYTYELTDTIVSGESYLIGSGNNGTVKILNSNGGTISGTTTNGFFTTTSSVTDAHKWTFTGSGTSYTIQNVSTDGYLYPTAIRSNKKWSYSLETDGSKTTVAVNNNSGALTISRSVSAFPAGSTTSYMTNSFGANNSGSAVYLYKIVEHTGEGTNGLYGKIVDNEADNDFSYNVTVGTSAEDAVAAVMAGVSVQYATAADYSDVQTLTDEQEKSLITWTLDSSYDGTTPGEYAVTIKYGDKTLGVAKVVVPSVAIDSYSIDPLSATVRQGASQSLKTGSKITVTLADGNYYTVPVTISMLSKNGEAISTAEVGTQTGLTVTYNGVVITQDFTLNVVERVYNDYPEYPDEGAVKVSKTATGIDFQSSGVARVELSASGVPAQKGADVVIVIDTSSSMDKDIDGDTPSSGEKSRIEILSEALEDMLITFQTPDDAGNYPDIDVAVIDFNGYSNRIDGASLNNTYRDNDDFAEVYTGVTVGANIYNYISDTGLSAANFVDVTTLDAAKFAALFNEDRTSSGTNYDSGLDNAHKLLDMKQAANGDEERDQYVIFLSDGAPFRYNGYENGAHSGYNNWDKWLRGYWVDQAALETEIASTNTTNVYPYFYNGNGSNHPHRIAEAIKGASGTSFDVVVNTATNADPAYIQQYYGLGAKIYSIGFGLAEDGDGVNSSKGSVVVSTMQNVLHTISSGDGYFYDVDNAEELSSAFTQIATAINYAANNARFVDQMGDSYNLQMTPIVDMHGNAITDANGNAMLPSIEIISYDIYTRQDYEDGKCELSQIGDRKGTYTVLETITFTSTKNTDGSYTVTGAYSDQIGGGTTNILADGTKAGYVKGVIYAKTFIYNTNATGVAIDGVNIPTATGFSNVLPAETFYWKMGTVQTYELAMCYYVYLAGSMEGTKQAGSYATNNFAILYYDNYLGNACKKETVSPSLAWKSANVSYAFYLVNEDGEIIVNKGTGKTGSFANKVEITNPVLYQEILLNNTNQIEALKVAALGDNVLPTYYQIYDADAVYTISIYSDGTGSWKITKTDDLVSSTYVTQYKIDDTSAYSNALTNDTKGDDYTHTVVWFAVVWKIQAHPDSVVIDYGLPVDISVLTNDMFGDNGKLAGIGTYSDGLNLDGYDAELASGFFESYTGTYGTAKADLTTGKVRYTLDSMKMDGYEKFAYAVNYTGTTNSGYYYDVVTVIPATTIYFEEKFVEFNPATNAKDGIGVWSDAGEYDDSITQEEDRPGKYSLADHNNLYGYDEINISSTTYSLGNAKLVSVNSEVGFHKDNAPTATFTFTGTGFDIISMTNSASGVIFIDVYDENGERVLGKFVDNYYGYTYDADTDTWTATPDTTAAIYQVPVMKISGLGHGTYNVIISVIYGEYFDHDGTEGYSFWLDSIRIYDPAGDVYDDADTTIKDAYLADNEGYPHYLEVKDAILDPSNLTTEGEFNGVVFIDGMPEVKGDVDLYENPGPNNEAYLAPGQAISFKLTANAVPKDVQLGAKLAYGEKVYLQITYGATDNSREIVGRVHEITTATDMYYTIMQYLSNKATSGWTTDTITITNVSDQYGVNSVLSLTNIKATFDEANVTVSSTVNEVAATASTGTYSLMSARMTNLNTVEETATEPVSIAFLVDDDVIDDACLVMTAIYTPEPEPVPVFTPEVLEYTVIPGFFGFDTVRVITSKDVASLTVNGIEAKKLNDSRTLRSMLMLISGIGDMIGIKNSANNYYVWNVSTKRVASYDIVAYNSEGVSSEPAVAESSTNIGNNGVANFPDREEIEKIMKDLADQNFDPEHFEAFFNKRFDGKSEIVTKTSDDVEYVIINGKIVTRYIIETVIDIETGEEITKRVWIADAEDENDVEVDVYDEKGVSSKTKNWKVKGETKNNDKETPANNNSKNNKNNNSKKNNGSKNVFAGLFNM